ncbi:MAG: fibronectin type III domain-containing protein, partial [Spirochaetaceae bacterium]|nr:fibronectin type III domain-containing protein [Spirochaetaceae bacterium]
MIPNELGLPARVALVAVAAFCWMVSAGPASALSARQVPSAPRSLTATGTGPSIIRLSWIEPSFPGGGITGYRIQASPDGARGWITVGTTGRTATTFDHEGLSPGTTLYYQVAAISGAVVGTYSNAVPGTTTASAVTPSAPRNLSARTLGLVVNLDWDPPAEDGGSALVRYEIRVLVNGVWSSPVHEPAGTTSHRHTSVAPGAVHLFEVRAFNLGGYLGLPATVTATPQGAAVPSAPLNLRATAAGASAIDLDWDAPASPGGSPIIRYEIYVSVNSGNWTLRESTTAGVTAYRDTQASAGTALRYRVWAVNALGPGAPAVVDAPTAVPPGPPRNLEAVAVSPTEIELDWDAPRDDGGSAITGYRIEYSRTGTGSWRTLEADTKSTDTDYTDTPLDPGTTRHYRVRTINGAGLSSDWSNVDHATTVTVPGAPTGLRVVPGTVQGSTQLLLTWTRPSTDGGSPVTGYRIEWSRTGTGFWTVLEGDTRSTATAYTHRGLSPGTTRHYRVRAINGAGLLGNWSNVAHATTEATVPGAPTALRAVPSGLQGSTQLRLTWTRPSDGGSPITGYRIEMSPTGVAGWTEVVASTPSAATTYLHTGLPAGTTRFYRVAAINARGRGAYSATARGTTNAGRPGPPFGLLARGSGPRSATLTWEAPATDGGARITGYTIRARRANEANWATINTGSTATTFTHAGLEPATAYRFQVAAINSVGTGAWSSEAGTTTYPDTPGAPVGLTARAVGTSRIDLSWSAPRNTGGAPILGYQIQASDDGGATWNRIRRNTNSPGTTFSDVNLQPATTRHYRVAALNTAGTGPFSHTARATTEATVPGAPRSLDAEADGTSRIELSWRAPTTDGGAPVTGYRVEVSEDGGIRWDDLVANSHNTGTTYVHTGLEPATRRHYRVSAINRIGVSRASRVASAITDATVPDAPTGLQATAVTSTQIDLFWLAPAYDGGAPVTGYRIEVSENGTAWTDLRTNTQSRATAFQHTGLMPGSTRHYRVSAINRVGPGAPSDTASAATDDPVGRAGRLNTRVLPHVAAAMTSSTVSAIARRVDAVASGMGMERRVETNGLSSMAASLSSPGAGGIGLAQGDQAGLAALFSGTSFTMPLGASDAQQQSVTGTQLAGWGAGEYHYLGEPGQSALDWKGNMVSAHAGIDTRVGPDILAGVAGSYSSGSFDFTDKTGASPVKGTYGTTMASVHPYMAWFSGGGAASVWGSAGLGRGDIDVDDVREGFRTTPASLLTGAGGASYQLLTRGTAGVRLKAEGWYGEVTVDGTQQIEEVTLTMQRGKVALELMQAFSSDTGSETAVVLEGGMRYDDGDGINGASAEVGGGLRYTNPGLGLTAEGRGRFVISARAGYEEWGMGGTLMFDPATRGQGLSIRVAPSYGNHLSGVNQLWERGVHNAVGGHDRGMAPNVDGEIAYGIAGFHGTPYSGFYLSEGGTRAFSSGVRYELGSGLGLRLEGTRRESGLGGAQ